MEIPQIDRSNYLKGLLILAKKDSRLTEAEKSMLKQFSDKLGFSSDFYDEIINNLLANEYIGEEPIKFSNKKIAESFIIDALRLAFTDNQLSDSELGWMSETAKINSIEKVWLDKKIKDIRTKPFSFVSTEFALYSLI